MKISFVNFYFLFSKLFLISQQEFTLLYLFYINFSLIIQIYNIYFKNIFRLFICPTNQITCFKKKKKKQNPWIHDPSLFTCQSFNTIGQF